MVNRRSQFIPALCAINGMLLVFREAMLPLQSDTSFVGELWSGKIRACVQQHLIRVSVDVGHVTYFTEVFSIKLMSYNNASLCRMCPVLFSSSAVCALTGRHIGSCRQRYVGVPAKLSSMYIVDAYTGAAVPRVNS